jgi:spore maturation protein CgeB
MQPIKIYHIGLNAGTNDGLEKAFKKVSSYKYVNTSHPNLNTVIKNDCEAFKPDLVFIQVQSAGVIKNQTIEVIRPLCGKIINFTGDVRDPLPSWYLETGKVVDITLFVSMTDVLKAKTFINCDWIQIGFDDSIFCKKTHPIKSPDIVFMANNYGSFPLSKYRREIVNALSKEFKSKFEVFGSGWPRSRNLNNSLLDQASIYRGSKIAINCSHFDHSMYSSDRLLRIMGSGTFCLSHAFPDHDKLYGHHLDTFKDTDDLIKKCHHYLTNEKEREAIAENGYNFTHELFTWDKMVQNLIYHYDI